MTDSLLLGDALPWPAVRDRLSAGAIPVLPFGAHEQHGPHLPLATDTIMAAGLARRMAGELDGLVLPAVGYGQTTDNDGFPGTTTLSFDTVRAIAGDVAAALARSGARCLVIVNGDFGNQAPLRIAAQDITALPVLVVNYPGLTEACAEICTSPPAGFALRHADEFETSVMLALAPELVQMDRAVAEYPEYPPTFPDLQVGLHTLSESGVFGDPTAASAEKGAALLDRLTRSAVALVRAFATEVGSVSPKQVSRNALSRVPAALLALDVMDLVGRDVTEARRIVESLGGTVFVVANRYVLGSYEPSRVDLRVEGGRVVHASSLFWAAAPPRS